MSKILKIGLLAGVFLLTSLTLNSYAAKAKIKDGKTVKFEYTLTIDDEVVETTVGKDPLEYTHGEGQIIIF